MVTVVKGDPKAPLSIATTPRCREGRYSFPWIVPLYLDTNFIMLLSKEASSTIFRVFGMTRPGIEPWSPGSMANILPTRPMGRYVRKLESLYSINNSNQKKTNFNINLLKSYSHKILSEININSIRYSLYKKYKINLFFSGFIFHYNYQRL